MQQFIQKIKTFANSRQGKKRLAIGFTLIFFCIGLSYREYSKRYRSTDDAYVNAHVVQIAARVSGQALHLYVTNNQYVHQGQLLFSIDPAPFMLALHKAQAQLAIDQAKLQNAQQSAERILALVAKKSLSQQAADDATTTLQSAKAAVELDKVNIAQAQLDLSYTKVLAPTAGWVTNLSLRAGNMISANQPLFAFVSNLEFWVDANYRETELKLIQPGQTASITLDMYPGYTFKGVVDSLGKGTGAAFSLLPPENATGNWVKVTQRIPIRVLFVHPDSRYPLRIGSSATVVIDTHSKLQPEKL